MQEPEKSFIHEFIFHGGWIIPLLGSVAMVARILAVPEKRTCWEVISKVIIAALSSTVMWGLIHELNIMDMWQAMIYGITGVISPEIIQGIVKMGKRFSRNPEDFIKKD